MQEKENGASVGLIKEQSEKGSEKIQHAAPERQRSRSRVSFTNNMIAQVSSYSSEYLIPMVIGNSDWDGTGAVYIEQND